MLLITGVYALVAFWNLGSTSLPVTCWTPQQGEVVVLRLDAPADTLRYLPGLTVPVEGESSVIGVDCTVSVSVDGLSWGEEVPLTGDAVYTWQEIPYNGSFSYVKLTSGHAPVVLAEMAFFDEQGKYVSYTVERSGETSEALHDEASEVPENPTWYDSMYFDEIYHARSAYEYLLGAEPYENTHPPLGKWIMAIGIMWFGMNPFGWRFMGALFGVLMLPLLYHMTKRLTRSSGGAFLATFLFAFDFMHITQTRMATIDTYAVFFTLVMFDGMLCFLQKDLLRTPVSRLLRPLAISGLGVGLGAAAKWNTLYGALGLAVLFFWRILSCRRNLGQQWQKTYLTRQIVRLITGCLGCFILLPALCYWLAFLPQLCLPGHSLGDFWGYQTSMYDYHSSLQATHAFSSSWWQWPLMERPVWYHVTYAPGGQGRHVMYHCRDGITPLVVGRLGGFIVYPGAGSAPPPGGSLLYPGWIWGLLCAVDAGVAADVFVPLFPLCAVFGYGGGVLVHENVRNSGQKAVPSVVPPFAPPFLAESDAGGWRDHRAVYHKCGVCDPVLAGDYRGAS